MGQGYFGYPDFQTATTFRLVANSTVQTIPDLTTHYLAAVQAFVQVFGDPGIRYGFGLTPAATTGFIGADGDSFSLEGHDEMEQFRFIRAGATNATLMVSMAYPSGCHPTRK